MHLEGKSYVNRCAYMGAYFVLLQCICIHIRHEHIRERSHLVVILGGELKTGENTEDFFAPVEEETEPSRRKAHLKDRPRIKLVVDQQTEDDLPFERAHVFVRNLEMRAHHKTVGSV